MPHHGPHGHHGPHHASADFHGGYGHPNYFSNQTFNGFGTSSAICTNSTLAQLCNEILIGDWSIQSPELVPCCLGALYLGITLSKKIWNMKTLSSKMYGTTFLMIGIMMTCASMFDCILINNLSPKSFFLNFFGVADVGLTSSIGFAFLIDGLIDCGILDPTKKRTYYIFYGGVAAIFYGWILCFEGKWDAAWMWLYLGVVAIGCGSWVIIQIALMYFSHDTRGWLNLLGASLAGGIGFFNLMETKWQVWECEHLSCYWGDDFTWFIVTDIAMYFIYQYYVKRHTMNKRLLSN
jgi:hypothetical protein